MKKYKTINSKTANLDHNLDLLLKIILLSLKLNNCFCPFNVKF